MIRKLRKFVFICLLLCSSAWAHTVSLMWQPSESATGYAVYRATIDGGPYVKIGTVIAPQFTDSTVAFNTTYFYVVTAVNQFGESLPSNQAIAVIPALKKPESPGHLTGNAT